MSVLVFTGIVFADETREQAAARFNFYCFCVRQFNLGNPNFKCGVFKAGLDFFDVHFLRQLKSALDFSASF
jgi:hypothetical protein